MSSSAFGTHFLLASLLLFLSASTSLGQFSPVTSEELKSICSSTTHPSFCEETFQHNPKTPGSDLPGLAQIVIDTARPIANDTLELVRKLAADEGEEALYINYSGCVETYMDVVSALGQADRSLQTKDFVSVISAGNEGIVSLNVCVDSWTDPPTYEPSGELIPRNQKMSDFFNIIAVVITKLLS